MPPLDHLPHEKFAHFVARGNHVLHAAMAAGLPTDPAMAELLARRPQIAERIKELQPLYHNRFRSRDPEILARRRANAET